MIKNTQKWKNPTNTITYNSWRSMRNRCLFDNPNNTNHKQKGITICKEWETNYDKFYEDMGERPINTTLDRIDPIGNYTLSNCRWSDWREQQNNKSTLTKVEHDGEIKTIGEWAYILDLTPTELGKVYKRYSAYNATTFEELFTNNLMALRTAKRNKTAICKTCGKTETSKWYSKATECHTCYHRRKRKEKKEEK